jgi:hypothetical protein
MTEYRTWEYIDDVSIEFECPGADLSIDHEGSIEFCCYGGTWVGDLRSHRNLTLEEAIELSVLLTSRIIPHLEAGANVKN